MKKKKLTAAQRDNQEVEEWARAHDATAQQKATMRKTKRLMRQIEKLKADYHKLRATGKASPILRRFFEGETKVG